MQEVVVELYVTDLALSLELFSGVLGMQCLREEPDFAELKYGANRLLINGQPTSAFSAENPIRHLPPDVARGAGLELVVIVPDLAASYAAIQASGIAGSVTAIQEQEWGASDFRFIHPDGFYIRVSS